MRFGEYFLHTLKEAPSEAEVISHQLMIRAGMIRKVAAGIYNYLPYGLRSLRKFEKIVREEMEASGAQELLMPAIQPSDLWLESGRWQIYGRELLRMKDRHDRDFCFGPTHEEVITALCRQEIRSYRDLPLNLYQIQTKFRDEVRPRFGLMRGREFIMKDAYSFDVDEKEAQKSYWKMYETYYRIFQRCGLKFRPVEALTGNIGGTLSHEFQVLAESGEDAILSCKKCEYAANIEKAEIQVGKILKPSKKKSQSFEKVKTPDKKTVEEVASFLKKKPENFIKTLIYNSPRGFLAACVRGDHEVNENKLIKMAGVDQVQLANEKETERATRVPVGFAGPIGFKGDVFVDQAIQADLSYVCGANEKDHHLIAVTLGDFNITKMGDLRKGQEGDPCPQCSGTLQLVRGIEVGQVFYLGTKYSKSMNAVFLNAEGKENPLVMGCYGIGIGRTVAAAIEQNHDEKGIIFPMALSPFQVILLNLSGGDKEFDKICDKLYEDLGKMEIEVLYDDRDVRAGVKFNDADLLGIPLQIIAGKKSLKEKSIEIKERRSGKVERIPLSQVCQQLKERINVELKV